VFVNFLREDRVTIMDEKAIPMIAGNGFAELLQGPTSSRMSRDIAVQNATAPTSMTTNTYSIRNPAVIATKKSAATMASA
jgi:hypothetical protein